MGKKTGKFLWVSLAVLLSLVAAVVCRMSVERGGEQSDVSSGRGRLSQNVRPPRSKTSAEKSDGAAKRRDLGHAADVAAGLAEPAAERKKANTPTVAAQGKGDAGADEEEQQAKAFDSLTDKWMKPSEKGVSMEDVRHFVERFRKLPKSRKGECLQRALNLLPDENVMLLAGVLMDKTQDKEYLDMVYNDVLNRDEDVKKPILQQIFKDREHPCWAETAWILDVTGGVPAAKADKK